MRSFGGLAIPEDLIRAAAWAVGSYLYSDRCLEVAQLDVNDVELRKYGTAGRTALSALPSFGSPQIHQGTIGELRAPNISNREPLSALPNGAFWTSTPITDGEDSWTLCLENLGRENPRWEVHFDAARVRVARIDSAADWADLIDAHPATAGGCKYPDWPAIADSWDAVHMSPRDCSSPIPKSRPPNSSRPTGRAMRTARLGPTPASRTGPRSPRPGCAYHRIWKSHWRRASIDSGHRWPTNSIAYALPTLRQVAWS